MVLDSEWALVFPSPEKVSSFLVMAWEFLEDRSPTVTLVITLGSFGLLGEVLC